MTEITTDELLRLYRNTKSSVTVMQSSLPLMEAMLMNRGVIRCPKCGERHRAEDTHAVQAAFMVAEVSG